MTFQRKTIAQFEPSERVLGVAGDIRGKGEDAVLVAGREGPQGMYLIEPDGQGGWKTHLLDDQYSRLEAGGFLYDLTGNGKLDFLAGGDWKGNLLCWWEQPDDPAAPWIRRTICEMPANQSHDQIVADLDGDGRPELYFWNQKSEAVFTIPVPEDPRVSPWPGLTQVSVGFKEEGFAVADVDGDGQPELIAGLAWFKKEGNGWKRYPFVEGFVSPRLAAADFDGDGKVEIIVAEGDASFMKPGPGTLARFTRPEDPSHLWDMEILHENLMDPHSLFVADFDQDGRPDLFVGELGDPNNQSDREPRQRIFWNRGGKLVEEIIDTGVGTHEAKAFRFEGKTGIVGKPYFNLAAPTRPEWSDEVHLWLPA